MCQHNPDQPLKPEIEVGDLLQMVREMEKNAPEFSQCGFFPPQASIDFVKKKIKQTHRQEFSQILPKKFKTILNP